MRAGRQERMKEGRKEEKMEGGKILINKRRKERGREELKERMEEMSE